MFELSIHSLKKIIEGPADPGLVACVVRAIQITTMDFCVTELYRSPKRQSEILIEQEKTGRQLTKNTVSKHQTGEAVHLVPWKDGSLHWRPPGCFDPIATAMRTAGNELGVGLRWGGCWNFVLTKTTNDPATLRASYELYCNNLGRDPFWDLAHFERV